MDMQLIGAEQVRRILTMPVAVKVMDKAMRAVSRGQVEAPPRLFAPVADSAAVMAMMPGSTANLATYGAKVMTVHSGNPCRGLPAIQGFVVLFDGSTGSPAALVEGSSITAIRTAAASGLATRELARNDATSHGIFGTGVQAASHLAAIAAVRPITEVVVWSRDYEKALSFVETHNHDIAGDLIASSDPKMAASCDIVTTVTASTEPVLRHEWLQPGAHINAVGAHSASKREIDSKTVASVSIYVDALESVFSEAGDLLMPLKEGLIGQKDVVGEIGQLLEGSIRGRRDSTEITLYKSVGVVAQDLFAADFVFNAVKAGNS